MKKEYILISLIILIISLFSIIAYKQSKKKIVEEAIIEEKINYGEKMSIIKKENGWYYYLYENTNNEYFFDGCNLKYKELDGYYVNIYTDNTMTELYYKMPTFPSLSTSDHSKNGILERDEVALINNYFTKNNFTGKILDKELFELELNNFNTSEIINLYNDLSKKSFDYSVTPYHLSECDYRMDSLKDGYYVNIGFLVERKGIATVEIDLVYKNKKYLSDIVENGSASKKQLEIYENFQQIEKYIVSTQKLNIADNFKFQGDIYDRVFKLLKSVESVE